MTILKTTNKICITACTILFCSSGYANQLETGLEAIRQMAGCYLVDYSYTETESLKQNYELDKRVYDVNKDKSVKEWIYSEQISDTRIRLQHILFATDLSGNSIEGSLLKHQSEDWTYDNAFLYEFIAPAHWVVKNLDNQRDVWVRSITNLDDGLRYQCASVWSEKNAYPEWTCDNFSPIPGRETRDMGRKDYNTLDRSTRIVVYGNSWLERQENIKTQYINGIKDPLAKELGKTWYVRLPDSECAQAKIFVQERIAFWNILREVWDEVLNERTNFIEKIPANYPPRYVKIWDIEKRYYSKDLFNQTNINFAKNEIKNMISIYRDN